MREDDVWAIPEGIRERVLRWDGAVRARVCAENGWRMCRRTQVALAVRPHSGDDGADVLAVAVRRDRRGEPEVMAVAAHDPARERFRARNMWYVPVAGWRVGWPGEGVARGCGWVMAAPVDERPRWEFGRGLSFGEAPVVNPGALAGTRYRHCGWLSGMATGLVDWLHLWETDGNVELLARAGLERMATPGTVAALGRDRRLLGYVRRHQEEIREGAWKPREVLWAARRNAGLEEARRHFGAVKAWAGRIPARAAVDADGAERYVGRVGCLRTEYARYLEEADGAGWDLRDGRVLFPPREAFRAFLERAEEQAHMAGRDGPAPREGPRAPRCGDRKILAAAGRLGKALEGIPEGVEARLPVSDAQFRVEGKAMGNCIGVMGYSGLMARDEGFCVFLRGPGGAAADMEVRYEGKVGARLRQCYGPGNTPPDGLLAEAAGIITRNAERLRRKWAREAAEAARPDTRGKGRGATAPHPKRKAPNPGREMEVAG